MAQNGDAVVPSLEADATRAGAVSDTFAFEDRAHLAGPELAERQRYRQPALTLIDGTLNWTDPSDRFLVGMWANNITDERYRSSYNGGALDDYGNWAWPRQYGVRVGFNF